MRRWRHRFQISLARTRFNAVVSLCLSVGRRAKLNLRFVASHRSPWPSRPFDCLSMISSWNTLWDVWSSTQELLGTTANVAGLNNPFRNRLYTITAIAASEPFLQQLMEQFCLVDAYDTVRLNGMFHRCSLSEKFWYVALSPVAESKKVPNKVYCSS
jgi:hypothetical protein